MTKLEEAERTMINRLPSGAYIRWINNKLTDKDYSRMKHQAEMVLSILSKECARRELAKGTKR